MQTREGKFTFNFPPLTKKSENRRDSPGTYLDFESFTDSTCH